MNELLNQVLFDDTFRDEGSLEHNGFIRTLAVFPDHFQTSVGAFECFSSPITLFPANGMYTVVAASEPHTLFGVRCLALSYGTNMLTDLSVRMSRSLWIF